MPEIEPNPNPTPTPAPTPEPTPAPAPAPAPTPEPKPGEPPKEPAKAEPFVPLTAEAIKLPEGLEADTPTQEKFLAVMNNRDLTPAAQAQALVDLQAEVLKGASERASQLWADKQTEWQNEVKADAEIGGAKLDETLGGISTMLNTYGTPELRQAFDETGAGNNVHIVRFLHKMAGMVNEPRLTPAATPAAADASLADRLFPNHNKPK